MNKKILVSMILAFVSGLFLVSVVLAGTTRDRGTLETTPPDGTINWTAWLSVYDYTVYPPTLIYPPQEIMTEDNFNASQGVDGGYTDAGWQIQVVNFSDETNNMPVNMSFCGLSDYAGDNWEDTFIWDGKNNSTTDHGEVPLRTGNGYFVPWLNSVEIVGETKVVTFFGVPETDYFVYRSTSPAAVGADWSNGRYKLQGPATTDENGVGIFVDDTPEIITVQSWYVVMYFADTPTGPHGCHSEEVDPTGIRMGEFTAAYDAKEKVVNLAWETVSELDILGFNVLRGTSEFGLPDQLNTDLIISNNPGQIEGSSYTYEDSDLLMGETYYYWIQIVGNDNTRESIGPREVRIDLLFFLPLIQD